MRVHQLMYWVKNDFVTLADTTKQISHLCHLASCAKIEHLVFESSQLNNARKSCKKANKCLGHGDENPFCLIWIVLEFCFFFQRIVFFWNVHLLRNFNFCSFVCLNFFISGHFLGHIIYQVNVEWKNQLCKVLSYFDSFCLCKHNFLVACTQLYPLPCQSVH